jgi:hypothetical protein
MCCMLSAVSEITHRRRASALSRLRNGALPRPRILPPAATALTPLSCNCYTRQATILATLDAPAFDGMSPFGKSRPPTSNTPLHPLSGPPSQPPSAHAGIMRGMIEAEPEPPAIQSTLKHQTQTHSTWLTTQVPAQTHNHSSRTASH